MGKKKKSNLIKLKNGSSIEFVGPDLKPSGLRIPFQLVPSGYFGHYPDLTKSAPGAYTKEVNR